MEFISRGSLPVPAIVMAGNRGESNGSSFGGRGPIVLVDDRREAEHFRRGSEMAD